MSPTPKLPLPSHLPWDAIIRLLRWDKPAGRLILLIPALWALVLATGGWPPPLLLVVVVVGTFATSGAGCVINDLWDRNIDPQVQRTQKRPLASRELSVTVGIVVFAIALLCAAGLTVFLTPLSFGLCVAAVPVIALYPGAKRVFPVPQLVLAIAWGFAVLIPWSAATDPPTLPWPAWMLWGATIFWTLGFDTIYAMADRDDDRKLGVNSSALFFGEYVAEAVGLFFLLTALLLAQTGIATQLNLLYWPALGASVFLWAKQYLKLRRQELSRTAYGKLFSENVNIGLILLAGMALGSWF